MKNSTIGKRRWKRALVILCVACLLAIATSLTNYVLAEDSDTNEDFHYVFPPVLSKDELNDYLHIITELEGEETSKVVRGFFGLYSPKKASMKEVYSYVENEDYYVFLPEYLDKQVWISEELEKIFAKIGYTKEEHEILLKKYHLGSTKREEETSSKAAEFYGGTEDKPLVIDFEIPTIYEAGDLEYNVSEGSTGEFYRLNVTAPEMKQTDKNLYPGIACHRLSVSSAFMVHDPKRVFGYEWFWIGGNEQTVYNGMNEDPQSFLSSLKRGKLIITLSEEFVSSWYTDSQSLNHSLVLEEKTTGLTEKIYLSGLSGETTLVLDLPATEFFISVESTWEADDEYDEPSFYSVGSSRGYLNVPFVGMMTNYWGAGYTISSPKVTISNKDVVSVSIDKAEDASTFVTQKYEGGKVSLPLNVFQEAAKENNELLIYDFIHADKLLPDQSSYSLYKLAKAYDKELPDGYYKQYLTSFQLVNDNAVLPIDVRMDIQDIFEAYGTRYDYDAKSFIEVDGNVYTNGKRQMFYVNGRVSVYAGPITPNASTDRKGIVFAYPMDTKTRVCGEMISAYDNPELFGYKKGDIDEREYAIQVLRCCSDLYQYNAKVSEWDMGVQMRFRSHMEKDPSSISGEKMVYDRTVCQYLPESVIKYITFAANTGVLIERDHSTPANSSSLWWEPLKKEPLGEIHLTDKDGETIAPPAPKDPVVETKDGTEPSGSAAVEQETTTSPSTESRDGSTTESRELKTMEYVEKEPASFNPATLGIIIIISVFVIAAVIGAGGVLKAKKKGN